MGHHHLLAISTRKNKEFFILMTFFNSSIQQLFIFINFIHFPRYLYLKKKKKKFQIKILWMWFPYIF
jgi:hypothetical protein